MAQTKYCWQCVFFDPKNAQCHFDLPQILVSPPMMGRVQGVGGQAGVTQQIRCVFPVIDPFGVQCHNFREDEERQEPKKEGDKQDTSSGE